VLTFEIRSVRILLTGGGTGGHLAPLIAAARELKKLCQEKGMEQPEILYMGPDGFAKELLEKESIKTKIILTGKLRRYLSFKTILDFLKFPIGLLQAIWHVFLFMPDAAFGKGGYGSVPAVLASRIYRIPVLLHESDTIPGLANKFLSRFAKRIAISFASSEKFFLANKTELTGNPIRKEITVGNAEQAKSLLGLSSNKPVIFIFGGSQGAQPINEIILTTLPQLLEKYELIWQAGANNYKKIAAEAQELLKSTPSNCHIFGFMDEKQITSAFAAATLVISRAGAGSIFEIAACGKPSIIIPLPNSASDHQKENAFEYARSGATVVFEQANLTPNLFLGEITRLINNPELLQKMSACAKSFAKPAAARKIAEELINLSSLN
ncbi:MAG: undecaprenyldiphospho-muramoylpentapeptide beta-N-acetylglucosaminyltransferase, partial [Candidatus Buchananbacteria bacterium RBG_13_39_9]